MANTLSCALAVLAILLFGNALFSGFYHIIRAFRCVVRMLISIGIYILAYMAGHNPILAETLNSIQLIILGISAAIIAVVFIDLAKMVKKDKKNRYYHRGNRRKTPARY